VEGQEDIFVGLDFAGFALENKLCRAIFPALLNLAGRGTNIMSMSDPIADMLTRVRNAIMRQHKTVSVPNSKIKYAIAEVLKQEGYIEDYHLIPHDPQAILRMNLKYLGDRRNRRSVITGLKRVSRPGRRVYVGRNEIPWVLSGMGISIMTTSQGVMTGQSARLKGVGGEVICEVW
jgi:small subunit ribosomal protein S8